MDVCVYIHTHPYMYVYCMLYYIQNRSYIIANIYDNSYNLLLDIIRRFVYIWLFYSVKIYCAYKNNSKVWFFNTFITAATEDQDV